MRIQEAQKHTDHTDPIRTVTLPFNIRGSDPDPGRVRTRVSSRDVT
jgi:hypothetical protein